LNVRILRFDLKNDKGGTLVPFEENQQIPFSIKRVFSLFDVQPGIIRGAHAHKNFQEVLVALKGSCKMRLDDGVEKKEIILNHPESGLCIGVGVWEEVFDFSPNCILLGLADKDYVHDDFIWDYADFIKRISKIK
jgi:hypothetical protein